MSLQNVKDFYERLASDEVLRTQLQAVESKEECSQIVKNAGYDFTQEEFEEYTAQLLESSSNNDEIKDLDEKELEAVFGGASTIFFKDLDIHIDIDKIYLPMYGMPYPWPIDIGPQPMYGNAKIDLPDEIHQIVVNEDLPKH